jgi:hypothetical protein
MAGNGCEASPGNLESEMAYICHIESLGMHLDQHGSLTMPNVNRFVVGSAL